MAYIDQEISEPTLTCYRESALTSDVPIRLPPVRKAHRSRPYLDIPIVHLHDRTGKASPSVFRLARRVLVGPLRHETDLFLL